MPKTYRDYVDAGICPTCKNKPSKGSVVLCERCHELRLSPGRKAKQRQLVINYKKRHADLGLCERCHNPHVEGKKECQRCIDRIAKIRLEKKIAIYSMYGSLCKCCGEHRVEFLTIDHVNGGGGKERKSGFKLYHLKKFLIKEGYANPKYQLLCMNCNLAKGLYGYCPHERELNIKIA